MKSRRVSKNNFSTIAQMFLDCLAKAVPLPDDFDASASMAWSASVSRSIVRTAWHIGRHYRDAEGAAVRVRSHLRRPARGRSVACLGLSGESFETIGGTLEEGSLSVGRRVGTYVASLRAGKRRRDSSLAPRCARSVSSGSVSGIPRSSGLARSRVRGTSVGGAMLLVDVV